ncbi:hypothetical protein [Nesterenkonia sandarakina]|uniref:Uncharacterized protein n=1 Tax=Nesterenkonia sandarakina TaxID=272918 RepID=A0A2T0YJ72_9MICC|nr:hypothetical protein [Nesterenkonia sandarakina]PRZ15245.1 hypothetical protein BCL67_109166 [Nesterenkonia sandarakina]
MTRAFSWVPDVGRGEWLRSMEAEPFSSLFSVVPRGFEMYARVFHPVERDRPRATRSWHAIEASTCFDDAADIWALLETERCTWSAAAASFGTTMHAEAQYARLIRYVSGEEVGAVSEDGWRYGEPSEGALDASTLTAASQVLARHTATPHAGIAAIWEGWGGLVSSAGSKRYLAMRSLQMSLPRLAPRAPKSGTGVLAPDIAAGPRFDLHGDTGRSYVLFEAGAADFADPRWPARAPWTDDADWVPSPSIFWPEDHSWVLATEIDYDSTLIAGTAALISDLVRTPGLEVLVIHPNADLTWDGDSVNRPA